jgi:cell division initiation protein
MTPETNDVIAAQDAMDGATATSTQPQGDTAMERMKPLDLERMEPPRKLFGYDRAAVRETFARASKEIERLLRELEECRAEVAAAQEEIARFRAQETTLKEAILLAQRAADETRANAQKEADLIRERARQDAAQVQQQMQGIVNDLRWEMERLRMEKSKFVDRFRQMLEEQLRILDSGSPAQMALINMEFGGSARPEGEAKESAAS